MKTTEESSAPSKLVKGLTLIQGNRKRQERYRPKDAIDKDYLQRLMQKHLRSTFLHKDVKSVQSAAFDENTQDMAKEFAKECYKTGNALPVSQIPVNELAAFRKDLYYLNNTSLSEAQSKALGTTFKYMKRKIHEVCFSNNNMKDKQFADLLAQLVSDPKQFDSLWRIAYLNGNELGPHTLAELHRILEEKSSQFPLTHLTLVNCKLRLRNILPLLHSLNTIPNVLQTLIIPQQNFGYDGVDALCQLIKGQPSFLKVLDISWNILKRQQIALVFEALGKNQDLEYLNLAMTSVGEEMDLVELRRFIRKNPNLLHLNLSGMFKTVEHVSSIVKAIAKNDSLLALHLSNTPVITQDERLQSYMRTKLNMNKFMVKPMNTIPVRNIVHMQLQGDWMAQDRLRDKVSVAEKAMQYY